MPPLTPFPIALLGGLQDSKPLPEVGDMQTLTNWSLFRGRFAVRAPILATARLMSLGADEGGAAQPVTHVLALHYYNSKLYAVGWRNTAGAGGKTYLYRLDADGKPEGGSIGGDAAPVETVWSGATVPRVSLAGFDGGLATSAVQRVYIADYLASSTGNATRIWNETADTIANLKEDFDDDGTQEDVKFHLVWTYQHHVWGAGYFQGPNAGPVFRPEIARFSQPGAISAVEPDVLNNATREWWFVDFRPVGKRGDKITGVGLAGGASILFKSRETHSLYGYDAASWALRTPSTRVGAVGPWAVASTEDGLCFFWSDNGPHMTDGQQVIDLGEDIRRRVQAVGLSTEVVVEYSPDDQLVYYAIPSAGTGTPNSFFAFDTKRQKWSEGSWIRTGAGALLVNALHASTYDTLVGPAAAPSGLSATAVSDSQINLLWTNGDTSLGVTTHIHRSLTSGFVPSDSNKIDEVGSGVSSYNNIGLSSRTSYFYEVRHFLNGTFSAGSGGAPEPNAKTWVKEPTNLDAQQLAGGVRVAMTQAESVNVDIQIERSTDGNTWDVLTTLTNRPPGAVTHDDTTTMCGLLYYYRAKSKLAGETDSEYSNVDSQISCESILDITSVTLGVDQQQPGGDNKCHHLVTVNWTGTNFQGDDTAKVYRSVDGGMFTLRGEVSLSGLTFSEEYVQLNPHTGTDSLQYRVEGYENGTVLRDTMDSNTVDPVDCPPTA